MNDLLGKRIVILGCPGSGKTTLALKLAEYVGYDVVHLDRYFWRPNWTQPNDEEWVSIVKELSMRPEWIIDGNYRSTLSIRLSRADTVILLDFNRFSCLFSAFFRSVKNIGRQREDIGEGCLERIDISFLLYIYSFNKRSRPGIVNELKTFPCDRIIVFKNRRQVNKWINDNYRKPT